MKEEERNVQAKHATADPPKVSPEVDTYLAGSPGGQPLAASTRAYFEPRFGRDFSGVRIHTDRPAAYSAAALEARPYTVGSNVFFGGSEYAPDSAVGLLSFAHFQQRAAGLEAVSAGADVVTALPTSRPRWPLMQVLVLVASSSV